jgi:hypothetical protein
VLQQLGLLFTPSADLGKSELRVAADRQDILRPDENCHFTGLQFRSGLLNQVQHDEQR